MPDCKFTEKGLIVPSLCFVQGLFDVYLSDMTHGNTFVVENDFHRMVAKALRATACKTVANDPYTPVGAFVFPFFAECFAACYVYDALQIFNVNWFGYPDEIARTLAKDPTVQVCALEFYPKGVVLSPKRVLNDLCVGYAGIRPYTSEFLFVKHAVDVNQWLTRKFFEDLDKALTFYLDHDEDMHFVEFDDGPK